MANNKIFLILEVLDAVFNFFTYFAFSGVSLHELIGFKFFFLVWHHSWHLEKELWSGDNLSLLLLVVVVVVGGVRGVEHVRMM